MKNNIFFAALTLTLISCQKEKIKGNGEITTESRTVTGFTNVMVSGSTNVYIIQGSDFAINVKAYSNLLPYLETKLQNNTLLIAYKSNSNIQNDNSEVHITMPELESLTTNGSGNIDTSGIFTGMDNFTASVSGSGNINIEGGDADNLQIQISGSGYVKSFGLVSQKINVSIEGSGDAEVHAVQELKANIKGSGNVYYQGNPATVNSQISGSGKLIKQ